MKIEFIKETDLRGNVYYYTSVDGEFETNSLSMDYSQAYEFFIVQFLPNSSHMSPSL